MDRSVRYSLVFGGLACLFFMPFLGAVRLFDWDEVNFAECSREMLVLQDYLRVHVDFKPFWEKPPFFFWCQSLAMQAFGVGAYAARFPNAVCGVITLIYLYHLGTRIQGHRFGILWPLVYLGSVTPHLYFRSGIIDPFFNLFIFIGLTQIILASWKREKIPGMFLTGSVWRYLFVGGFVLGIGIMTKGPVAYLIICLTLGIYWALNRFRWFITPGQFLWFTGAATLVSLTWYGIETYTHGPWFMQEFIKYNYRLFSTPDAGHGGFFGYHFVILLVGCFPASIFAIRGQGPLQLERSYQRDFRLWMVILFWVVLILFSIVKSKIVHYSSMCYFPLTYLAALTLQQLEEGKIRFSGWLRFGLLTVGLVYVVAVVAVPFLGQHPDMLKPLLAKDPFAQANLNAKINWTGWEIIPGLLLLAVLAVSLWQYSTRRTASATGLLFGGTAVFVTLTLWLFINKIEEIPQGSAMRFLEDKQGKDVYVRNIGYRTYGVYFYTRKPRVTNPNSYDQTWLMRGAIDKPVYFITKITEQAPLDSLRDTKRLGDENGFAFYMRPVPKPARAAVPVSTTASLSGNQPTILTVPNPGQRQVRK
jgi:4-amino-4-deoxy-L-arabinose transferase-like glycosyltransferase